MRNILVTIIILISSTCFADDRMTPVFEKIDDLVIRIDSGISLNSFAESFAELKIEYKKVKNNPEQINNPLLDDRMKFVIETLDDYARVWKGQEVEGFKFVPQGAPLLSRHSVGHCRVDFRSGVAYGIPCVKVAILDELRPLLEKAKSAHYNGW
ncbi:MAG: hypothetical protein C5B59_01460 [Bacteroidetes bacterium]|nr:MAG: hypothetical protein C5B59_01460 [Bacteroidota bacterium]